MMMRKILLTLALMVAIPLSGYAKKSDIVIPENFPKKFDKN